MIELFSRQQAGQEFDVRLAHSRPRSTAWSPDQPRAKVWNGGAIQTRVPSRTWDDAALVSRRPSCRQEEIAGGGFASKTSETGNRLHADDDHMSRGRIVGAASSAPQRNGVVPVLAGHSSRCVARRRHSLRTTDDSIHSHVSACPAAAPRWYHAAWPTGIAGQAMRSCVYSRARNASWASWPAWHIKSPSSCRWALEVC